jgi:hypothetical protein
VTKIAKPSVGGALEERKMFGRAAVTETTGEKSRLLAGVAQGLTVTRVELLKPLETLPDSKALTPQNSRSFDLLDELLGEPLDRRTGNEKTKNNLFDQGDQLDQVTENTGLGGE